MCEMNKRSIEIKTDDMKRLIGFPYHDGVVESLFVSNTKLEITIKSIDETNITLRLENISDFTINELWNGAIISDLFLWKLREVPTDSFGEGYGFATLYGTRQDSSTIQTVIRKKLSKLPEAFLFELSCSYGGELACICESAFIDLVG